MTPEEIDRILAQSAQRDAAPGLDSAALARAKASVPPQFVPVRPLAPAWVLVFTCFIVFAAVSALCAWALGMRGLAVLSGLQRAVIFPVLLAGAGVATIATVREMRPASGPRISFVTITMSTLALLATFSFLFRDYDVSNFIAAGVKCLVAGLACAIPAALVISALMRRGFILDGRAAGLAAGTLAGLAGIGMLELHCPILKAPHVMFWHVVVVPVSGLVGWLVGRTVRQRL